ncbi:sulfurtransferase-like selenium metabolism protein YedF [Citricoccus alkalitolerans]|uniref:Sulfurtransferase-like selenium metabolism protein YedF n=1 Tax=Citricoccus alkalitolerans TaxID=246603 RepID=A0ABV8XVY8_9MICC
MTTPEYYALDLRGESCPYPVIHTLEALHGIKPGEILQVQTDCPQAYRNIPDDATAAGHELMADPSREGAVMTFTFRRGEKVLGKHLTQDKPRRSWFRRTKTTR